MHSIVPRMCLYLILLFGWISLSGATPTESCPSANENSCPCYAVTCSRAKVGSPAPYFEATAVVDGQVTRLNLTEYQGKFVVLLFYPLDFTFVCPTELIAFSEVIQDYRNLGAEVIACSVDSYFTHLKWLKTPRKEGGLLGVMKLPLISDLNRRISIEYGVYMHEHGHSMRAMFIIDDKGILRHTSLNDLGIGRSTSETLRLISALQHSDENGEVCPADWMPGDDTIIPNPEQKLKYFANVDRLRPNAAH